MSSLVTRKFAEWTKGLDPHESRIAVFEHIRDFSYSLAAPHAGPGMAVEQLLSLGRGSCGAKHYLLAEMFRRLGLNVVYATFAFTWNDPDFRYPPPLRERAAHVPESHHLACRVQTGCRWALVDATWDPPLAKAGFPVNLNWDGFADTKCAVKPLPSAIRSASCRPALPGSCRTGEAAEICPLDGEQDHGDDEDRAHHSGTGSPVTPRQRDLASAFYRELDAWMETFRQAGRQSDVDTPPSYPGSLPQPVNVTSDNRVQRTG